MTQNETPDQQAVAELTREYIEKWQGLGLMPELAPGEVLVWKHVIGDEHLVKQEDGGSDWEPHYAAQPREDTQYFVGVPYACEGCIVSANPLRVAWHCDPEEEYEADENFHRMLALRVEKDLLRLCPTGLERGSFFYAPRGVPVSAYLVYWFRHRQYQFALEEGEDAIEWLSDPLAYVEEDYAGVDTAQLPPPLTEVVKPEKWRFPREKFRYTPLNTPQALKCWQDYGWMPEVSPGKILVWKCVERLGKFRGRPSEYRSCDYEEDDHRLWLDTPFHLPDCDAHASWEEAVWDEAGDQVVRTLCLAILADRNGLVYHGATAAEKGAELDDDFAIDSGIPVACYEALPAGDGEYALRFIEGEDVREWLPSQKSGEPLRWPGPQPPYSETGETDKKDAATHVAADRIPRGPLPSERETVRALLDHCRTVGLTPQREPGQVLLWMGAARFEYPVRHRGHYQGSVPLYHATDPPNLWCQINQTFQVGAGFRLHASPVEAASRARYNYPVEILGVWADLDDLRLPSDVDDRRCSFMTHIGLPVAVYEAQHSWGEGVEGHFEFRLLEGVDVLQELQAPYEDLGWVATSHLAPRPEGVSEARWSCWLESGKSECLNPLATRHCIQSWQAQGLMPEVEPGRFLVWKCVTYPQADEKEKDPATYRGMLEAPYEINQPFLYPDGMACAGPMGAARGYVNVSSPGMVLALLIEADSLFAVRERAGVFYAGKGIPVACYHAEALNRDEFDLRLLEGEDAMALLGDAID